jgi:outer membrane protein assembly factor BamE (lipoprotein component of BamABCDE complex)
MRRGGQLRQRRMGRWASGCRSTAAGGGLLLALAAGLLAGLAGCTPMVTKHGHLFQETDIQQIQPGLNQDQVKMALGTPDTSSPVGAGTAFYYISSTSKQQAFTTETEVDRRVLAVYFTPLGTVERVAHYGMKDGKVFDFVKRETPSHAQDEGLVKKLFRNLGTKQLFGD